MNGVENIKKGDNSLIGIISSNYRSEDMKPFKNHVFNHFNQGGGMVYVYSNNKENQTIDCLTKLWELDANRLYHKGRITFICREDFLEENQIDTKGFLQKIREELNQLDLNGTKKKLIYITVDSFWGNFIVEDIQQVYDNLNKLGKDRETKIVFRYIVEELQEKHMENLLKNHDYFLVDGTEDFEIYNSSQLTFQAINVLSRHNATSRIYQKEMMRVEYLKTLGELMEGTVHDINNLLITILGYAQLSMTLEDPREVEDYLKIIHRTAMDGKTITDRIQNHIRGSYDSLKDVYKFNSIVNSCIDMTKHKFKPIVGNKGKMELIVDLQSNGFIYANEYEIRQAIINIILNGIDAMANNGKMIIKTYDIGSQVVLEISDTGKGMDENTKDMIFRPYFSTKGDKGTGLGLNIAKKIFDNHRAKVLVDSKLGHGTKFTIFLPLEEKRYNVAELDIDGYNIN